MLVLRKIHETAAATPRKLALVFNGAPLTYGSFWRFIEGCRRSLEPQLPTRGLAVVWVDSLLEAWILELALRALGLDTANVRSADQADLFVGPDVAGVITLASEGKEVAAPAGARRLVLEAPSRQAVDFAAPLPTFPAIGRPGGHVTLTSGTTGLYKRVLGHVGNDWDAVERRRQRYADLGPDFLQPGPDTVLNLFNLALWSSGGHGWPIFVWALGGAVALDQRQELQRAFDWPGLTHTLATPLYLAQLMALPEGAFPFLPQMQLIVNSGAVGPALARETMRRLTPRLLINMSSTEAGGWARSLVRSEEDLRWYPIDRGRVVEVVDENDAPLPPGKLGRVRVALTQDNATEYLDDPDTTKSFFSGAWFYSGDLGELDGKGRIALSGRVSDIVSVGGVKLPAEPFESAIRERLGADAVCVLTDNRRTGAEEAHVFVESRRDIARQDLEAAVREVLAAFGEVRVHVAASLPRTPTGKVRRLDIVRRLHDGGFEPGPSGA
jgi:acyl-coenzyme A synthetase/AMP-(fatty) acid ligase